MRQQRDDGSERDDLGFPDPARGAAAPGKRTLTDGLGAAGGGAPLPAGVRGGMERSFGVDFGDVRVHEGGEAAAIGARAFARGSDLHFGPGEYAPDTAGGREVLGHELAHVVQQRAGRAEVQDLDGELTDDPALEAEADAAGQRAARGEAAALTGAAGAAAAAGRPAAIQRLTFRVERGDPAHVKDAKLAHIAAQRALLLSLTELYVSPDERVASPVPTPGWQQVRRDDSELLPPSDSKLAEIFTAKFRGQFRVYTISFITNPDHDPRAGAPDDGARARVRPPFPVERANTLGTGGDIGRPAATEWAWDVNPAFRGSAMVPNLGGNLHEVRLQPESLAAISNLPRERHVSAVDRRNLRELPAPSTQPVIFYCPLDMNDASHRHHDRAALPFGDFGARFAAATASGEGFRQQGGFSMPHATGRHGSDRDPGDAMGGPASGLMPGGWSAQPSRGILASHEWCHLVGDGDGGECNGRNLVIGTNQVNTEQLAMENGLRAFRDRFARQGLGIYLDAKAVGTEVDSPDPDVGRVLRADWICYSISVRSLPGRGAVNQVVHSQVMDAARGTITRGEFEALRRLVMLKIESLGAHRDAPFPDLFGATYPADRAAQQHPHVRHNEELIPGSPAHQQRTGFGGGGGFGGAPGFGGGGFGGGGFPAAPRRQLPPVPLFGAGDALGGGGGEMAAAPSSSGGGFGGAPGFGGGFSAPSPSGHDSGGHDDVEMGQPRAEREAVALIARARAEHPATLGPVLAALHQLLPQLTDDDVLVEAIKILQHFGYA